MSALPHLGFNTLRRVPLTRKVYVQETIFAIKTQLAEAVLDATQKGEMSSGFEW
jgi:hypothetical protein